jgi:multidrug efflux system membrane fusion protein
VTDHLQSLRQNLKVEPRIGDEVSAVGNTPAQGEARH